MRKDLQIQVFSRKYPGKREVSFLFVKRENSVFFTLTHTFPYGQNKCSMEEFTRKEPIKRRPRRIYENVLVVPGSQGGDMLVPLGASIFLLEG